MAWDGNGSFSRTNGDNSGSTTWAQDAADGDKITAARHDSHDQDLADGIEACLAKNGENSPSAHLQWIKDHIWAGTSGGSANAQTLTFSPAPLTVYTGMKIRFKAGATNTGALTINPNSLGATSVKCPDGSALIGGEVASGRIIEAVYDGTNFILTSFEPAWTTFSPGTFTPSSGSLSGMTATIAIFKHWGDRLEYKLVASGGTLSSADAQYISYTLPKASANLGTTQVGGAYRSQGSPAQTDVSVSVVQNNSTSCLVYGDYTLASTAFLIGSGIAIHSFGTYRC